MNGLTALSDPLTHDIILQWIPFREFIKDSFAAGMFPLWAPQVFAGFPFAAFSHTGVFYPPGFILNLGSYPEMVNLFYPLHLYIAGSGVYALTRRLGLSPISSLFAACAYVFTGKAFYFVHFLPSTMSNAWMAWMLFSALGLLRKGHFSDFALTALFLSLQVLGGDVESTAYGLLFGLPALIILIDGAEGIKRFHLVGLAFIMAAFICAAQLLPLLEFSRHFVRNEGVTFEYFSQRHLSLRLLSTVLIPSRGINSGPIYAIDGPVFYLGIVALFLAALAVIKKAYPSTRPLAALAFAALLWSFGSIYLIDRIQFLLPVVDSMGSPEHAFFMMQIFLAILSGHGLDIFSRRGFTPRSALAWGGGLFATLAAIVIFGESVNQTFWHTGLLLGAIFVAAVTTALIYAYFRRITFTFLAWAIFVLSLFEVYAMAFTWLPQNRPEVFEYPAWLKSVARDIDKTSFRHVMVSRQGLSDPDLVYHAGLALDMDAIDGWITVPPRRYVELMSLADPRAATFKDGKLDRLGLNVELKDGRFIDAGSMPLLDLIGLGFVIDRAVPIKFSSPYPLYFSQPDYHRRSAVHGRVSKYDGCSNCLTAGPREVYRFDFFLHPGDELVFRPLLDTGDEAAPDGHEVSGRFLVFAETADGRINLYARELSGSGRVDGGLAEIDLSSLAGQVKLVMATEAAAGDPVFIFQDIVIRNSSKPFQMVDRPWTDVMVYFNKEVLPRAFVVHDFEVIEDRQEMLDRLKRMSRLELASTVLLESPPPAPPRPTAKPDRVAIGDRGPGVENYQVSASSRGLLFVSNQYYPGWKARVEGEEKRIQRADYNFWAVPVEEGVNQARFSFEPVSFRIGLYLSIAGAIFLAAMTILFLVGKALRKNISPATD